MLRKLSDIPWAVGAMTAENSVDNFHWSTSRSRWKRELDLIFNESANVGQTSTWEKLAAYSEWPTEHTSSLGFKNTYSSILKHPATFFLFVYQ